MTISPEMRYLARLLLVCEADAEKGSTSLVSPTLRAYDKLRQCLVSFVGVAGFQSIVVRALALAQSDDHSLSAVQVTAEGALLGTGEFALQTNADRELADSQQAGTDPPGAAGETLIACILSLLLTFLGEALTLSLLRSAWPNETFDDRNSGNGRSA